MDISSAASVSAMQTSMARHDVTANNVANVNTPGYEQMRVVQAETKTGGVHIAAITRDPNTSPDQSNTDLAQAAVDQITDKNTNAANAAVVKVKDRMLGDLLDLIA
jgi:flagellar hook protein FlgE